MFVSYWAPHRKIRLLHWALAMLLLVAMIVVLTFTHRYLRAEAFTVGYSAYDALRDHGMQEQGTESVERCRRIAGAKCGPQDGRPGSDGLCFSLAMSQCMYPHTQVDLPFYKSEFL